MLKAMKLTKTMNGYVVIDVPENISKEEEQEIAEQKLKEGGVVWKDSKVSWLGSQPI